MLLEIEIQTNSFIRLSCTKYQRDILIHLDILEHMQMRTKLGTFG